MTTSFLVPLVLMGGIFYLLVFRPQQKQVREHKSMLGQLKKGEEVVTSGGLVGRIHAVADKLLTLEVAKDVRIRVLKSSVQNRFTEGAAEESAEGKEKEKKEDSR